MSLENEIHHLTMAIAELAKALSVKTDLTTRQNHFDEDHKVSLPSNVLEDAPKVEAPKVEAPKVDAPKVDAPKVDAPKVDAPKVDAPKVDAPKVDAPKVEAPKGPTRDEVRAVVKAVAAKAGGNEKARAALNSIATGISVSTCPEDRLGDLLKALNAIV